MQIRTLIVTGAAGFIGCNFVRLALAKGYRVVAFDALTYAGHKENLADVWNHPEFKFVHGDIRNPAAVKDVFSAFSPNGIVNFAAESHVDRSIANPLVFVETNVLGTANLLHWSLNYWRGLPDGEKEKFRYVQVSTDEVFGSLGDTGKFSEKTPVDPSSPYSASKTGGDHLVKAWQHTYGLPAMVTRCSNNYGPYQYPEKLIPHMINCALSGKPLPVYGTGANVRDWIHVADHCRGILLTLEKGKAGDSYCFGGNSEWKNIDLVKLLCKQLDQLRPKKSGSYADQITFVTDRLGHDHRYAIDDSYAKKELGYRQEESFENALGKTIEWYLKNESWKNSVLAKGEGK